MNVDPTTVRWKLQNTSCHPLTDAEQEYLTTLVSADIGYPPPDGEQGDGDDQSSPAFETKWHSGAPYGGSFNPVGVCFHHAAGTEAGTVHWLTEGNPARNASYHVLIGEDGTRHRFVDDEERAWHAGASSSKYNGGNPNGLLLGVAFVGDTVTGEWRRQKSLSDAEIDSAVDWLERRKARLGLTDMTDHRRCDPTRRNDLSPEAYGQLADLLRLKGWIVAS